MKQEIKELVERVVQEEDASIREKFCETLIGFKQDAIAFVLPHFTNEDWTVRYRMAKIIDAIRITDKDTFLFIEKALEQEKDEYVRDTLLKSLMNSKIEIITPFSLEKTNENLVKLWTFSLDEIEPIKDIFTKHNVNFRELVICLGHPDYDSYNEEVAFEVPESQVKKSVDVLLHEYFGLDSGNSYTGECPACNTPVVSVTICPECELSLEMNPLEAIYYHRFGKCIAMLIENGLVEKNILGEK